MSALSKTSKISAGLTTIALLMVSGIASAQEAAMPDAAADNGSGAEIVVTALRRSERLLEVPASISVLDASTLQAKGAQDFRDYLNSVPSVNFSEIGYRNSRVTIRGISDGFAQTSPLTGIYIDEAPVTEGNTPSFDPNIYDIERVEVLKGPQGTLYGSGSMGGTVRIITRKPVLDRFEGSIDGSVGVIAHGGFQKRIDGVVNVPLVNDLLALRVTAGHRFDQGWIDDVFLNDEDGNTVKKSSARAQLLLKPAADTTIIGSFLYQKETLGLPPYADRNLGEYETSRVYRQSGGSDTKLWGLTIQQDFDNMSLTAATNYLDKASVNRIDATASLRPLIGRLTGRTLGPREGIGVISDFDYALFTQEIRLASKGKNRLDWLVGAFYSDADTEVLQPFDATQAPTLAGVLTGPEILDSVNKVHVRQVALFGELTFNITDQLALTAGLRGFDVVNRANLSASGILNGGNTQNSVRAHDRSVTQKYLAKYQIDRDHMVFAQASQGYRNGGVNMPVPVSACGADLALLGYSASPLGYEPDKLWNYEIGTKNSFAGGKATLNASAFYIDWRKNQTSVGLTCGFGFIDNVGRASSKGAELEVTANPVEGLTLSGSVSYVGAKVKETSPGTSIDEGDRLPLSPRWSWNVSSQYDADLGGEVTGFLRGEVSHVGSRWNQFEGFGPASATQFDGYTTTNARIGVRTDDFSVSLYATNLFDNRIVNYRALGSRPYDVVATPRVVGLSFKGNF